MIFPRDDSSPSAVMEAIRSYWSARTLLSAYELDIFSAVGAGDRTSAAVAATSGTDPRATDRMLNALCSLGLLEKKDGRFSNTPLAGRFLDRQSPRYLRGLGHFIHLWDSWSTLTAAVKAGTTVLTPTSEGGDARWLPAFIAAMDERARPSAPEMIRFIDLTGVRRTLDIGGGSGAFSIAMAQASPAISATVFDLPAVLTLTGEYVDRAGLAERIKLVAGDYNSTATFGSGFDLVLLSAILHSNSPEENIILLRKAAQALNPGGRIVIAEFLMREDRCDPPFAALFALNMLVATRAGDTYTETEIRDWLTAAGISAITRHDTRDAPLLIGRKA